MKKIPYAQLSAGWNYIRRIRNDLKREYAYATMNYMTGVRSEPSRPAPGLSVMAAQAVRMQLAKLIPKREETVRRTERKVRKMKRKVSSKNEAFSTVKIVVRQERWERDGVWYNVEPRFDASGGLEGLASFRNKKDAEYCARAIKAAILASLEGTVVPK